MKLKSKQLKFFKTNGYIKLEKILRKKHFDSIKRIIDPWVNDKIENWFDEGLISHKYSKLNFWQRFLVAWKDAGKPSFRRNPNKWLINNRMYKLLKDKVISMLIIRYFIVFSFVISFKLLNIIMMN